MGRPEGMEEDLYKKILIATDGSETANEAADFGIEMFGCSGAKIYALHVIDNTLEETGDKATSYIEEKAKAAGLEVETRVLKGHPAERIITFAEDNEIDMIIVGSLGKSGTRRFILGSVSENVVRHAKVPVLVVRERHKSEKKLIQE
jgi:nucleotide-binding universal stress UspA family protein